MSAHDRIRAIARLTQDRGLSREAAEVIALALIPLDVGPGPEGVPVSLRFPRRITKRTRRFRKSAQAVARDVLIDLARETIEDYLDLAVTFGEEYYIDKFEAATAGPAPWVAGSIGAMPDAAPESVR
jgi:hypothetical protein